MCIINPPLGSIFNNWFKDELCLFFNFSVLETKLAVPEQPNGSAGFGCRSTPAPISCDLVLHANFAYFFQGEAVTHVDVLDAIQSEREPDTGHGRTAASPLDSLCLLCDVRTHRSSDCGVKNALLSRERWTTDPGYHLRLTNGKKRALWRGRAPRSQH